MNLITLDFETFFSDDYTLKKLTTEAYIRDPRFEALCVGIKEIKDTPTIWVSQSDIADALQAVPWHETACLCHHAHFDGLILSHHYGIKPAMWFDTLSMARLLLGNHVSASLGALAKHFELPEKNVPYDLFRGKHWHELGEAGQQQLGDACCRDVELTYQIFQKLLGQMPRMELDLIDMTIRMFTEPSIRGDVPALRALAQTEHDRKEKVLAELGVTKKELASAQQFAAILTGLGIEVEYKETPGGNTIPAVAKTDEFMKGLVEDENEIISALAASRLDVRSTLDETRAARLAGSAERGCVPVYLSYCAAHTHRWGGGDRINFQNFRRRRKDGSGGGLRESLMAPDGHLIMTVDESQVECRFLEAVAGEELALQDFRDGKDPYCGIASDFYGRPITKADAAERGMGKQIRLSCGYGAGAASIITTAKRGTYGPPVILTDERGLAARDLYRRTRPGVVNLWKEADEILKFIAGPAGEGIWRDVVKIAARGDGSGWIEGPNGAHMFYRLEWNAAERGWKRRTRKGWPHIWGGVVVQNLMEFLCRIFTGEVMIKVRHEMPWMQLAWMSHDELNYVVPESTEAPAWLARTIELLSIPPLWLPNVPLAAEGGLGKRYEK